MPGPIYHLWGEGKSINGTFSVEASGISRGCDSRGRRLVWTLVSQVRQPAGAMRCIVAARSSLRGAGTRRGRRLLNLSFRHRPPRPRGGAQRGKLANKSSARVRQAPRIDSPWEISGATRGEGCPWRPMLTHTCMLSRLARASPTKAGLARDWQARPPWGTMVAQACVRVGRRGARRRPGGLLQAG